MSLGSDECEDLVGVHNDISKGKLFVTYEQIERASRAIESMLETILAKHL